MLVEESHFIPFADGEMLHVRRFCSDPGAPAVLMLPGSVENGYIFYSKSGKGFAPWLAQQGFDVFVADLRGRGQSTPPISRASTWGQDEALKEEYPAYFDFIHKVKGSWEVRIVTHSWAGVNVLAFLARHTLPLKVPAMVFFGSKRHISIRGFRYFMMIILGWRLLARRSKRIYGYLNAIHYRMGSDNISARDHSETDVWIKEGNKWLHWYDGFDYRAALHAMQLPPTLYFAGQKDHVLGHPKDVTLLADEAGKHQTRRIALLAKKTGHLHDYGHIDMLTHPDAPRDHFPMALDWLRKSPQNP